MPVCCDHLIGGEGWRFLQTSRSMLAQTVCDLKQPTPLYLLSFPLPPPHPHIRLYNKIKNAHFRNSCQRSASYGDKKRPRTCLPDRKRIKAVEIAESEKKTKPRLLASTMTITTNRPTKQPTNQINQTEKKKKKKKPDKHNRSQLHDRNA